MGGSVPLGRGALPGALLEASPGGSRGFLPPDVSRVLPACSQAACLVLFFLFPSQFVAPQGLTFTLVLRLFSRWEDTGWQPLGLADLRPALALLRGRVVHVASGRSRRGLEVKWAPAEIVASPQTVSCLSIPAR